MALGEGLALGAIYHFITGLTEEADALVKQSRALGLSYQQLQEWNYVAALGGASAEALSGTLAKLGAGKFDKGLAALGIKTKDASGQMRDSGDLLEDVADALKSIENPAERNRKAIQVLGKSYTQLLPVLEGGGEGIRELRKEFHEMGGGFSDDFAKTAEEFNDNITRVKTQWKSITIMLLASVMPTFLALSKRAIQIVKPLVHIAQHSKVLETVLRTLVRTGVLWLSAKIGPLGQAMKVLGGHVMRTVIPFLILEDALVFLAGGKSVIGRLVDRIFGEGSGDKVRAWIAGVKKDFLLFIDDLKNRPLKLLEDWEIFTTALKKDIKDTFGGTFGEMLIIAGGFFMTFIDLLTGGWTNFKMKTGAIWDGILLTLRIVWLEWKQGWILAIATIEDAFTGLWNRVLGDTQNVLRVVKKVVGAVGATEIAKDIGDLVQSLESRKGAGDAGDRAFAAARADRLQLAAQGDSIGARLAGQGAGAVGVAGDVNVNVTVPPGTPAEIQRRVGNAAASSVKQTIDINTAYAALVPSKG